jgi:predicted nucleic acid-binding protein
MSMVLVDTTVWIRALAGKQPYRAHLDELLDQELVLAHELVYGELMIGDAGGRARALAEYARFRYAPSIPHRDVVDLVRARKLYGRGIGWIDVHLLASSLVAEAQLYTADHRLHELAQELGAGYLAP